MKDYDIIVVGTGSVMNIVSAVLDDRPNFRVAVIDKDTPGGICLTRGCIPSKILLYPAELLREALRGEEFGIKIKVQEIDFKKIMERMRKIVGEDVEQIRKGLTSTENLDFYNERAEFVSPNVMKVGNQEIRSNLIILGLGSEPLIPPIRGLEEIQFLTSDTILELNELPSRVLIVGGGYVAAEYGHFLSAMGSQVTIVGRNTRLLPQEEPEVSEVLRWHMSTYLNVLTGYEVTEVQKRGSEIIAKIINVKTGERREIPTDKLLIAAGRRSTSHYLKPELGGVKTDEHGWIVVDEYLRTTAPNVWALGDGLGKHMFKHVANYESAVVYQNAILGRKVKVNYNAVPHAIFTYPEVASVGMKEEEAVMRFGGDLHWLLSLRGDGKRSCNEPS
jgi:dihydrolipoamide dehydrogenase